MPWWAFTCMACHTTVPGDGTELGAAFAALMHECATEEAMDDECRHGLDPVTCTLCNGREAKERKEMRDVLDATYHRKTCDGCGATFGWAEYPSGAIVPLDLEPVHDGNVIVDGEGRAHVGKKREIEEYTGPRYKTHFATCSHSATFRRTGPTRSGR